MAESVPAEVRAARLATARLATERRRVVAAGTRAGGLDRGRLQEIDDRIGGLLDEVLAHVDPLDASEAEPLVLLPVRLETRFAQVGATATLKVRIYPDEVHVDSLERGLTADERTAGQAWWTAAWAGADEAAFARLVDVVGAARAEWVAHACTPRNLAERASGAPPDFPDTAEPGLPRTVARALPDRFVVVAVQGGQVSRAVGRPVPRDLQVSPVPTGDELPVDAAGGLVVPPGSEWLVDFDAATAVGMGVTVTLAGGNRTVDRLVALGTRSSQGADAGADELEDLLTGHRFTDGLGLLAQGTPTNNSDGARSPYRPRRTPVAPAVGVDPARADSDTSAAAGVLGLDAQVLTGLLGHGSGEQSLARDVNTALWPAGWGEYLTRLQKNDVPGLSDAQRESARRLFGSQVRGRGPAPALHVGAQPYGVLPVSDLHAWKPQAGETTEGVHRVVERLLDRWLQAARTRVPQVRAGRPNLDATMLDVLGSSPVMQGLRVRPLVSEDVSGAVEAAMGIGSGWFAAERQIIAAVAASVFGQHASRAVLGSLHKDTRPLPLPLVSERDPEFVAALLGTPSQVLAVDSVLQALLYLSWQSGDSDAAKASPAAVLPDLLEHVGLEAELTARTGALIARADDAHPDELFAIAAELGARAPLGGAAMLSAFQPVESLQTSLAEVALSAPVTDEARLVGVSALGGWFLAMGYRSELRTAMQSLVASDLEARRRAVAESLDCASHRLDAWATAVVSERRARQHGRGDEAGAGRGLTIGAWGVVEDLVPGAAAAPDGWIHAPTTRHAVTAGMLRSSHLSHLPSAGSDGGPFAIDLSSARARRAAAVLDGVRSGQQLAALVGYQVERGLAEAGLARLQLSLRTVAPLVARRLHDRDDADTDSARESVAATNVVDGLLLLKQHPPGDTTLRTRLDVPPVNAYLPAGAWKPMTDAEWAAVTRVLRAAADTVDAVADVMLSESVMQYAAGNATRAAAAMDVVSSGADPSDSIDVLEAQDSGERLTHRVLTVLGGTRPMSGWSTARPRATAEPALEDWAASYLGPADDVVVAEVGGDLLTLADAGLAALDLVFAEPTALDGVLRAALPGLGDAALAMTRQPAWPASRTALGETAALAGALRAVVAGAQPLLPGDLARPGTRPERDLAAALPELCSRARSAAAALGAAVSAMAAQVHALPEDGVVADEAAAGAATALAHRLDPFGIPLSPEPARPLDVSWVRRAWESAEARAANAASTVARLDEAVAALASGAAPTTVLDAAQDVAAGVFGDGFLLLPVLEAPAGADPFVEAVTDPAFAQPPTSAVRRFVRDHGTVRPQLTRFGEALLLRGALGSPAPVTVAQLSERVGDPPAPAPGTATWLAGPLPAEGPWPASPVGHLVLDTLGRVEAGGTVCGLAVDSWTEDLPAMPGPTARADDPRPGRARTGLAVRSGSASARPPQAILCAVSPDGRRWTTDALRAVVEQTLDLARIRMATLERLTGEGAVLPALYVRHGSLQGRRELVFTDLVSSSYVALPFVKDKP